MSQIDWNEVRAYYLACRSYKQTGEQFGVSPDTIRTRCRREQWGQQQDLNTPSENPGVQMNTREHSASVQMNTGCSDLNTDEHSTERFSESFPGLVFPMLPNAVSQEISFGQPWDGSVIQHDKLQDRRPTAPTSRMPPPGIACSPASGDRCPPLASPERISRRRGLPLWPTMTR